jgi:hypothetical protein
MRVRDIILYPHLVLLVESGCVTLQSLGLLIRIKEYKLSPTGDAPREDTVKRQPLPWS